MQTQAKIRESLAEIAKLEQEIKRKREESATLDAVEQVEGRAAGVGQSSAMTKMPRDAGDEGGDGRPSYQHGAALSNAERSIGTPHDGSNMVQTPITTGYQKGELSDNNRDKRHRSRPQKLDKGVDAWKRDSQSQTMQSSLRGHAKSVTASALKTKKSVRTSVLSQGAFDQ